METGMKIPRALALAAMLQLAAGAIMAAAPAPKMDMVVNAGWLAANLAAPDLVILHLGKQEDYQERHIPGARLVTLKDISEERDEQTMQIPAPADLKQRLAALGIGNSSRVVVYYGKDWISPSTRVIFTLYAAGLGEHVALLDGGMDEWIRQGRPTTKELPPVARGAGPDINVLPVVVDRDFVRTHAGAPGYALVDARAPVYYDGVEASGDMRKLRKGHIPGAVNIPFTSVSSMDFKLKPRAQWEAMFRDKGIGPGTRVIVYCHIGQQATAILFAARAVGIDAVLYDGSFEDWTWRDGQVEAAR
jgi:thiosulfate/3-mercaptopyruvate sulfurtransferase